MISFAWYQPEPAVMFQWVGPVPTEQITSAFTTAPVQIATLVGPPGQTLSSQNAGDGIEVLGGFINLNIDALPQG